MNVAVSDDQTAVDLTWPQKADVLGVQVSCVDYDRAVSCVLEAAKNPQSGVVACHAVQASIDFG